MSSDNGFDVFEIVSKRKSPGAKNGVVHRVRCNKCDEEDWKDPDVMGPCEFCGVKNEQVSKRKD